LKHIGIAHARSQNGTAELASEIGAAK